MPYRRRRYGVSRPRRQTNWLARADFNISVSAGAFSTSDMFSGAAGDELEFYTNPTLARIIGQVYFDPSFSVADGSQYIRALVVIWFGRQTDELTFDFTDGTVLDGALSSDSILWTGMYVAGQYAQHVVGTESNDYALVATQATGVLNVDIKAQRKFEDLGSVHVTFINTTHGNTALEAGYMLRALIKE